MAYFTIVTRATPDSRWIIEFGDYEKEVVDQEMIDSFLHLPRAQRKVVKTKTARQREIDQAINQFNQVQS